MSDTTQNDLPAVDDDGEFRDTAVPRVARSSWFVIGSLVAVSVMASWLLGATRVARLAEPSNPDSTKLADASRFEVVIRQPDGPPRTDLGIAAGAGSAVTAACSTCHANRQPDRSNRLASHMQTFHQGLVLAHGNVSCLSCHNAADYDSLMLADGTPVEFTDVMQLCGQCHGPQTRDYHHGAHGGMTGYWDLSRGPRQRNNCVDCHDPHAPAFPKMRPTFKPRDRFLEHPSH